ncbi:hypothetical protein V2J09_000702 [Rumex salicifolius]
MDKEQQKTKENDGSSSPAKSDSSRASNASVSSSGTDSGLPTCRVCQCVESDKSGDAVLGFLGIAPPIQLSDKVDENRKPSSKEAQKTCENKPCGSNGDGKDGRVEFISPEGEVFVCNADEELGLSCHGDALIELGCSCKNDLALVHYACGLKWFINHGSTVCEICGCVATNIRSADYKKILGSLKDYETLREMTASGVPNPTQVHNSSGVDPDALAAIRRQRLSEISLWFNPYNSNRRFSNNNDVTVTQLVVEQPSHFPLENVVHTENPATRWAVEGTAVLLATGLLTVTFALLIAPHVGKKTARSGLHILLGGVCALAIVIFFRIIVLARIRYGPARYWAILFVFWFLVFGIWASRTHSAHTT